MTTPRDAIAGLTDYLRKAAMALYLAIDQTIADELSPKIKEAATQLDSLLKEREALGERVKELDGRYLGAVAARGMLRDRADEAESRALRAEQERDEAYELAATIAENPPKPEGRGHACVATGRLIAAAIRRLAGPEKI